MSLLTMFTIVLLVAYGLLNALAGGQQLRLKKIQAWSAAGMLVAGALMVYAAVQLAAGASASLVILLVGLLLLHGVTINNGIHLHGKITWSHHLGRFLISCILLTLTYLSLGGLA